MQFSPRGIMAVSVCVCVGGVYTYLEGGDFILLPPSNISPHWCWLQTAPGFWVLPSHLLQLDLKVVVFFPPVWLYPSLILLFYHHIGKIIFLVKLLQSRSEMKHILMTRLELNLGEPKVNHRSSTSIFNGAGSERIPWWHYRFMALAWFLAVEIIFLHID